jgi:hypothetical protein
MSNASVRPQWHWVAFIRSLVQKLPKTTKTVEIDGYIYCCPHHGGGLSQRGKGRSWEQSRHALYCRSYGRTMTAVSCRCFFRSSQEKTVTHFLHGLFTWGDATGAWPTTPRLKVTMAGASSFVIFLMVVLCVAGCGRPIRITTFAADESTFFRGITKLIYGCRKYNIILKFLCNS